MKVIKSKIKPYSKPYLVEHSNNVWAFVHPPSFENETIYQSYYEGISFLEENDKIAEEKLKKLALKYPYYIDVYNHLSMAYRNQGKTFESLLTAEKSYSIAMSCLPEGFNWDACLILWNYIENRPFFRALLCYGLESQYHKNYDQAVELYKLGLSLDPEDHQGIRYLLLETYFAMKDYTNVTLLLSTYKEDSCIEFAFGSVTLSVLQCEFPKADKLLKRAMKTNPFFVAEVCKEKHTAPTPYRLPGEPFMDAGIPVGSIQEAYEYWIRNKTVYKRKDVLEYYLSKNK